MSQLIIKIFCFLFFCGLISPVYAEELKIEELSVPSVDSIGLLDALDFRGWGNYPFLKMEEIVLSLCQQRRSSALYEMTRMVLSDVTPVLSLPKENQEGKWLLLRLKGLFTLGSFDDVLALIDKLPPSFQNQEILQIKAETFLMKEDIKNACALSENLETSFWQELHIFCQLTSGEKESAELSFTLWREQNPQETFFARIVSALMNDASLNELKVDTITPIELSLITQMKIDNVVIAQLPSFVVPLNKKQIVVPFGNVVHLANLLDLWRKGGISLKEQIYRVAILEAFFYVYERPTRLIHLESLDFKHDSLNSSLLDVSLMNKKVETTSGADVLIALFLLSEQKYAPNALHILKQVGFDNLVEEWILQEISQ